MSTSSAQLAADIAQLHTDAGLMHNVIHGDANTTVLTSGGAIRSVANAVNSITQFNYRGTWATATAYAVKDLFVSGTTVYLTLVAHTSTTVSADLSAGKIAIYQGSTSDQITVADSNLTNFVLSRLSRVVDSIAALRALSKTTYTRAQYTGYYAAGDGAMGNVYQDPSDTTSGAYFMGSIAPIAAPATPTLSSSAGGTLAATTYYVKVTYQTAAGETAPSAESSLAVASNNLLGVNSPAAQAGATGYNVYVSTTTGAETKQNSAPIAIGTNWTEPTTGLISGAALPSASTAGSLLTVSAVNNGTLAVGQQVNGAGSVGMSYIAALVSGTGGTGTYTLTGSQTVASQTLVSDNGGTYFVAFDGARWKLLWSSSVTLRQFGGLLNYANGTGTDDSIALANALTAVSVKKGGEVVINADGVAYIASNQTIPAGVTLRGPFRTPDSALPMASNSISILGLGGAIALNSAATITLAGGAAVDGILIYRSGIVLPATNSTAFAGTCFTVGGPGVSIRNSLAVGFNQLILSSGYERLKVDWFYGDGQNGIEVTAANDIPRLSHVHLWPFATYTPTAAAANHYRTGKGIYIHDTVDGAVLFDCFVFGYATRFAFANISTVRWIGCMADGDINQAGSIGLQLAGNINGLLGTANALWSCVTGISINMNAGQFVDIVDVKFDGCSAACIDLIGGGADVTECFFNNSPTCLKVENVNVEAYFDHNQFAAITGDPITCATAGTVNVVIGQNNYNLNTPTGTGLNSSNLGMPGLTAAATLNISPNYHNYFVTGTVAISTLAAGWKDRIVRLKFTGAVTVNNGTGTNAIRLSGGANYTSSAGSTLSLIHDGTQWYEIGRTT